MAAPTLATLSIEQREALAALIANPIYELIPIAGVDQAAAALPPRARVTVTASPRLGIDATIHTAGVLSAAGHDVAPHLAARSIRDRAHLVDVIHRIRAAGIRKLFVVGGDGEPVGEFRDGLSLLQALAAIDGRFDEIGVPSYPEGHPVIPESVLWDDLRAKQRYAHATTTQMSFNPGAVADWMARVREQRIGLPIHLGVPGVMHVHKLMKIALRIGVGGSTRYLMKNQGLLGQLVRGSFAPDALLTRLGPTLADRAANVRALHLFTMNQVAETVAWQRQMQTELAS